MTAKSPQRAYPRSAGIVLAALLGLLAGLLLGSLRPPEPDNSRDAWPPPSAPHPRSLQP